MPAYKKELLKTPQSPTLRHYCHLACYQYLVAGFQVYIYFSRLQLDFAFLSLKSTYGFANTSGVFLHTEPDLFILSRRVCFS